MTKEIPKTRLETNFVRLLDQCKAMANNGKHTEWRFEQVSLKINYCPKILIYVEKVFIRRRSMQLLYLNFVVK